MRRAMISICFASLLGCAQGGLPNAASNDADTTRLDAPDPQRDAHVLPVDGNQSFPDSTVPIDGAIPIDAAPAPDAASPLFCSDNTQCTDPGTCCFVTFCVPGTGLGATLCFPS